MKTRPPLVDVDAAIRIGEKKYDPNETRWGLLVVLFMRIVACLWILQGLAQWHIVLTAPVTIFDHISTSTSIAIVYFAVIDLIAAIGLWLASPWGGVFWLIVTLSQVMVALALPDFFGAGRVVVALDSILICLYFFLTYKAAQAPDSSFYKSKTSFNKTLKRWGRR